MASRAESQNAINVAVEKGVGVREIDILIADEWKSRRQLALEINNQLGNSRLSKLVLAGLVFARVLPVVQSACFWLGMDLRSAIKRTDRDMASMFQFGEVTADSNGEVEYALVVIGDHWVSNYMMGRQAGYALSCLVEFGRLFDKLDHDIFELVYSAFSVLSARFECDDWYSIEVVKTALQADSTWLRETGEKCMSIKTFEEFEIMRNLASFGAYGALAPSDWWEDAFLGANVRKVL